VIVGEVHLAYGLLGQPRAEDLGVRIAESQAQQHPVPVPAPVVEALGAGQEQLADAIERIGLAAAVAQGLVLHPPAHLVQTAHADRKGPPRFIHIGLAVPRLESVLERLDHAGVFYLRGDPTVGKNRYVNDPDGIPGSAPMSRSSSTDRASHDQDSPHQSEHTTRRRPLAFLGRSWCGSGRSRPRNAPAASVLRRRGHGLFREGS